MVTAVSLSVYTGSSTGYGVTIYLGIYSDNNGMPGTRLAATSAITYTGGTTGAQTGSISLSLTAGTVYWLVSSVSAAWNCVAISNPSGGGLYGFNPLPAAVGSTTVANQANGTTVGLYTTDAVGALPSTLTGVTVNPGTYGMPLIIVGT